MNKLWLYFCVLVATTACSEQYNIEGFSSVRELEGRTLYLKAFVGEDVQDVDSCEVVHGKFSFHGDLDSTLMANLFVGEESVMPLVLERGHLTVKIDKNCQDVTGSPLNDTLYNFIKEKTQIDTQVADLSRKESQMIMDGMEHDDIVMQLDEEARKLAEAEDLLVTRFITQNFDNVLGAGVFMIFTSGYPYPVLTPQIEYILTEATPYFRAHPYVKEYMSVAKENMEKIREAGE